MDFFAAEAHAHARARRLLVAYGFAVLAVVAAITGVVALSFALVSTDVYSPLPYSARIAAHPGMLAITALAVLGIIGIAALHRMAQLSAGGGAVATAMGGVKVTRETQDPKRRRLLNVVEELAIAAGVPVPEIYVLEQEAGINAFAAGFAPADAAVTVTRGALERLNRAELQGVIGHEFSHILNGDMRLNTRLAGPLFGLLVIAIVARYALRLGGNRSRGGAPLVVAALAVMVLGYLGVLLGRLLQAAISRQSELLADASSVQFTRDVSGLRDALTRIARAPLGSQLATPEGEDLAHLFIAPAYDRWFSTHPPLPDRIRALDPHFDLRVLEQPEREPVVEDDAGTPPGSGPSAVVTAAAAVAAAGHAGVVAAAASASLAGAEQRRAIDPTSLSDQVGNPGLDAVRYAAALRAALPADIEAALARGSTAACLWLALALSADAAVRARQLELVRSTLGEGVATAVAACADRVRALPAVQHLPLLQRALPALKSLPAARRQALVDLTSRLAKTDGRIGVHEYLLGALASRYLSDQMAPRQATAGSLGLDDCAAEFGTLFAVVAQAGNDDPVEARRAYEMGLSSLLPRTRPDFHPPAPAAWVEDLDRALKRLASLSSPAKELLVDALGRTLLYDGTVRVREAELLRAIAAVLHCPLPPLFGLSEDT
jgi:Zn-dependent protease with chaperone function